MGGAAKLRPLDFAERHGFIKGLVKDIMHDPGRGAPLARVTFNDPYKYRRRRPATAARLPRLPAATAPSSPTTPTPAEPGSSCPPASRSSTPPRTGPSSASSLVAVDATSPCSRLA